MKIGVYIFPTKYSISVVDLARALEDRGFESLFVPEHTHIPVSRRTPFPGGEPLPRSMPTASILLSSCQQLPRRPGRFALVPESAW